MRNLVDIIGNKYGRWTVLEEVERRGYRGRERYFLCKCECGNDGIIYMGSLMHGKSLSCGCYHKERVLKTKITHGNSPKIKVTTEYSTWSSMITRCTNPKNKSYKNYGAKGISVCEEWVNSFEQFIKDMGKKPTPNHSLDRYPNQKGNYEPGNCRWATPYQQSRNKSNNVWIEHNGKRMIYADWARFFKINPMSLRGIIKRGKTFAEAYDFYLKKRK